MAASVEILQCPNHQYYAIAVNGTRIVGTKCCGSWEVLARWPLTRELVIQIRDALKRGKRMRPAPKALPPHESRGR